MELKLTETFTTIWSLELSVGSNIRLFSCCPINYNEWLVIDGTNSQIYHITKDGKFKNNIRYDSVPYRANLFNSNTLAISTEYNLKLCRCFQ
jgi:outer membrane protein assembly factor BamB